MVQGFGVVLTQLLASCGADGRRGGGPVSYVIAQLGARTHYAVPRILHADGQLMPISALEAITHSTPAFVAPWVQMAIFLLPGDISCPSTSDGLRATR
jgi:hypothetical protein